MDHLMESFVDHFMESSVDHSMESSVNQYSMEPSMGHSIEYRNPTPYRLLVGLGCILQMLNSLTLCCHADSVRVGFALRKYRSKGDKKDLHAIA